MSLKLATMMAVALAATGKTVTAGASPVCEQLLNDIPVSTLDVAEVDSSGHAIIIVTTGAAGQEKVRPVAASDGSVRAYSSPEAAANVAKRSTLPAGTAVNVYRFQKEATLPTDPVKSLISKHKAAKTELANATKAESALATSMTAATVQGWNTAAAGSAEAKAWEAYVDRQTAIAEWKGVIQANVQTLADGLTSVGINPTTYAAIPSGG